MQIHPVRAGIAGVMVLSCVVMLFMGIPVPDFWIGFTGAAIGYYFA